MGIEKVCDSDGCYSDAQALALQTWVGGRDRRELRDLAALQGMTLFDFLALEQRQMVGMRRDIWDWQDRMAARGVAVFGDPPANNVTGDD